MGKIANIKKLASEGKGSVKMIEYLLWYIECQNAEIEYLRRASKIATSTPDHSAANQIAYHLRMIDTDKMSFEEGNEIIQRFKKNP